MTYCLGIRVKSGLVAMADTRITSGSETTTSKKLSTYTKGNGTMFLMTSGLRSIRDKAITYFEEALDEDNFQFNKMYKAVNAFGSQLRKVADEDKLSLLNSGLGFNLFAILGGKLHNDESPKLFLVYPEGNWIEIGEATPFTIIGNSGYGKPILNRTLNYDSSLRFALKTGVLSFDSTRVSANDVGYPLDVIIMNEETGEVIEKRFEEHELKHISSAWGDKISNLVKELPEDWIDDINKVSKAGELVISQLQ